MKKNLLTALLCLFPILAQAQDAAPNITMGNGEDNWIKTEGMTRDGGVLTFTSVRIARAGWLVVHPFENGAPNGDKYVGATYLPAGTSEDVSLEVYKGLSEGERFIVMLHFDSNENGIFDFVFIDERNVMDRATFEGNRMIGHVVAAP